MYDKIVNSTHPALILQALDTSNSMIESIGENQEGKAIAKIEALRDALTRIHDDLILKSRARKNGQEIIKDLFHIYGITFGGEIRNLYAKELVTPKDLNNSIEMTLLPSGRTPMGEAAKNLLTKLKELLKTGNYEDSYPPIVFALSDGHYTDENPVPYFQEIQNLSVKNGNVLVVTTFFSPEISNIPGRLFHDEDPNWSEDAKTMFQSASIVPNPVPKSLADYFDEVKIGGQNLKITSGDRLFFTVSELDALVAVLGIIGSSV